ncbi:MAG: primosomal protein N' [Chitinivibrionales bacterium]|nr:primosomal protein N' [Chitinivibrionales bacterium]
MIAKVAFPISIPGIFDYVIPQSLLSVVGEGVIVKVSLRNRLLWGIVVETSQTSSVENLKAILEVKPLFWSESGTTLIQFYRWIAHYYACELGKVFRPFIRNKIIEARPKIIWYYTYAGSIPPTLSAKQRQSAQLIATVSQELTLPQLIQQTGLSTHMVSMLLKHGVLRRLQKQVLRQAEQFDEPNLNTSRLTQEQNEALNLIWNEQKNFGKTFLLFGITGSGKTHIYLELAKKTLALGKTVIILVPEIGLTPQTIGRFKAALGGDIAVIHSRMTTGQRRDSIEETLSGNAKIVIGVRSAILVPMANVGLIIVDEEHDQSYKQSEMEPRYHGRDVAVMRGAFQNSIVVLGSATPSFESYYNALLGKYTLVTLSNRFGDALLPKVTLVDMNKEHEANNWSVLSQALKVRIQEILQLKRQIILLLNRRGFSLSLICTKCGHKYSCPNCSIFLVFHTTDNHLKCHLCGFEEPAPVTCTSCGAEQIKYKGTGIQKVEEYLKTEFPGARIRRMDQDSTRTKGAHVSILEQVRSGQIDILLGTQMVAKGLDFPNVQLVGVVAADIGLHVPDFRASERTFQLLTQVAGRAGRSDASGEVIIQTYSPQDHALICAQKHDFYSFYDKEIVDRTVLKYPPFSRLARIIVSGESEAMVRGAICAVAESVTSRSGQSTLLTLLGPSPALISRLNKLYRYGLLLKAQSPRILHDCLGHIRRDFLKLPGQTQMVIDVDPVNML